MNQGHINLTQVEVLVLDEADRMLDMGFIHDIKRVVAKLPEARQTMFFSATMPREIKQLADAMLRDPVNVQVAPVATLAGNIDESVYFVEKKNKPALLAHLFNTLPMSRAIVFSRTKHGADKVVQHLHKRGIRSEAIHGNKSQNARQRALDNFKAGRIPILVATDIASRGIDVDNVTHVVNFDLTHEPETYVHRIGRTARAGTSGAAVSFVDKDERSNLRAIEKLIRKPIPVKNNHPDYEADLALRATDKPRVEADERHTARDHSPREQTSREHAPRAHHAPRASHPLSLQGKPHHTGAKPSFNSAKPARTGQGFNAPAPRGNGARPQGARGSFARRGNAHARSGGTGRPSFGSRGRHSR
jgi:ATP-dependent RNA helicase RhlE